MFIVHFWETFWLVWKPIHLYNLCNMVFNNSLLNKSCFCHVTRNHVVFHVITFHCQFSQLSWPLSRNCWIEYYFSAVHRLDNDYPTLHCDSWSCQCTSESEEGRLYARKLTRWKRNVISRKKITILVSHTIGRCFIHSFAFLSG